MTRRDLVIEISNKRGRTHAEVERLIEDFIALVADRLAEGRDVTLRGFGTLELRVSKSKIGRNPKRPEAEVRIPERCTVRFKPSRELKERLSRVPIEVVRASKDMSRGDEEDTAAGA